MEGDDSEFGDPLLQEYLDQLDKEGLLSLLRNQGRKLALRRYESQESFESESVITGSFTEASTSEIDDISLATDFDTSEKDLNPGLRGRKRWLKLGTKRGSEKLFAERCESNTCLLEEGEMMLEAELKDFLGDLELPEGDWAKLGYKKVMDRSTGMIRHICWSKDLPSGSTQYRSRTLMYGVEAETARDFFLDDGYRGEWDESRVTYSTLEDWNENGCQVARWVRKFPLFLRDREYVVARRIWCLSERTFHCISKLTTHPSAPKRTNPWRVSALSSSWKISPLKVETEDGNPKVACELVHFHLEESGISRNLAKMAVSRGMWPYIQKLDAALRSYQAAGRNVKHLLPVFLIQGDAKVQKSKKLEERVKQHEKHVGK